MINDLNACNKTMLPKECQEIAVFDFDKTLSTKSSTIPFLRYLHQKSFLKKFIPTLPTAILFELKRKDIDALNTVFVKHFFEGMQQYFLFEKGAKFNREIMPTLLNPAAINRLQWHKKRADYCLLATSAYDIYINDWAFHFGFDAVVSTEIEFDTKGLATGGLATLSCYGEEKLRRINKLIKNRTISYAYGDSGGDKQMLEVATHAYYRVFK